jgi:thioredoxin-like negative regulator of GroEL
MDRVAGEGIPVSKINIDYDATAPAKYSIKSVPTVVLVQNGQEVKRFVGVKSHQEVMSFYNG